MTDALLELTADDILADPAIEEPLVVGGVRCHGGFDADGRYVSPRTRVRVPAIAAWQAHHAATFGAELLDIPLDTWPPPYPNVEQARFLLRHGVREPIVADLTRIGTVEGFGAMIRHSAVADVQRHFVEDVRGTALAHLDRGLLEAHARDEAGHEGRAGHREMWFAARDVAFEHPVTTDQTATMLERMGLSSGGSAPDPAVVRRQMEEARRFPDIDFGLEMLAQRMIRILLIEISAFHLFAWAEELLADRDLVAGDGAAATLVSYIRQDERPHVEYLRTALSEMRERTFVGEEGERRAGREVIGRLWDEAVAESTGARRRQNLAVTRREIEHALAGRRDGDDLLAEFDARGDIRPDGQGGWRGPADAPS